MRFSGKKMDKNFQQFLKKRIIPALKEQLNLARFQDLNLEFSIEKLEKEFEKLKNTPILEGGKWKKQLEEHAFRRAEVEKEIENLKKQKEENLRKIEEIEKLIEWLGQKAKKI